MDDTAILSNPATARNRVYVGNLSGFVSTSVLAAKFSVHGKIIGISRKGPSFCFIEFSNEASARSALERENESNLGGRKISVKTAATKFESNVQAMEIDQNAQDEPMNKKYFTSTYKPIATADPTFASVNHVEIVVLRQNRFFYIETIHRKLTLLGFNVGIIERNPAANLNKIFTIIKSQGSFYAIQVDDVNVLESSMTIVVLVDDHVEHRNIPFDEGIKFLVKFIFKDFEQRRSRNFKGIRQHPESIKNLIHSLVNNGDLTTFQYDIILNYLRGERGRQVKHELGEEIQPEAADSNVSEDLQRRIYEILSRKPITEGSSSSIVINGQMSSSEIIQRAFKVFKS